MSLTAEDELQKLVAHLREVQDMPSIPLDWNLLDSAGDVLVPQLNPSACGQLVTLLGSLFAHLEQDPTPAAGLARKVLHRIPVDILTAHLSTETLPFELGMQPDAHPSMRELVLIVLELLSHSKDFITQLAISHRTLFASLIELWLCVSDIGAAEQAEKILYNFLLSDTSQAADELNLLGPVWKTMFHDRDIYCTFYHVCNSHELQAGSSKWPPDRRVYPRGRLLSWLPQVAALKWSTVASSQLPEVEQAQGSLLEFAAKEMKGDDDVLAHLQWICFCRQLLTCTSGPAVGLGTIPLDFLISHGAHSQILNYYINPHDDPMTSFLRSEAGNYLSIYMTAYPTHFLASTESEKVLDRLNIELDIPPSRWPYATSIPPDLKVLVSLDKKILANISVSNWETSPLSHLPPRPLNANALDALAIIFRGQPISATIQTQPDIAIDQSALEAEWSASRCIYWTYMDHNPGFWIEIIKHAKTEASPERALAAIGIIDSVLHASWINLPTNPDFPPSPPILHVNALPYILPYLNLPAPAHSSSWEIATAKFDVLRGLDRLMDDQPSVFDRTLENWEQIRVAVKERVRAGVLGRGSGVGGDIATVRQ